uniref:DNA-dependent protein kinase catalytic subunit n=1 Tax=Alvinella pompejana TaxID=6376 RepID=A0A872ZM31_9ANNE|nr:DNA-dependent protein kinase catalytic subunit [Alvinella pompejana]
MENLGCCCALLFSKETGITNFLKKVVQKDEFLDCKVDALKMLLALVVKYDKKLLSYSLDLKDVSMSLFLRDRFAKVKVLALDLLIEVVTFVAGSEVADELKISGIAEKLFTELVHSSRHPSTVQQRMYQLLGVIAEMYPELMVRHADRLVNMYVVTIKKQMTSKTSKPDIPLITGSLKGLCHLLVHFTQSAEEEAAHSCDIYKYTCAAISKEANEKLSKYEMAESGLKLLAKHASQFNKFLLDEYKIMYERLAFWCHHHNRVMMHLGFSAMEAFFKQISAHLVLLANEGRKERSIFMFFMEEFRKIMDNPESSSKEISLAIHGYGYFATPCRIFLSQDDVKFMFTEVMQRSEQMLIVQAEYLDDRITSLPHFLEALASIIKELSEVTDTLILLVEKLILLLVEHSPKLPEKLHYIFVVTILKVCFSLTPKGSVFRSFISRFVYQALLRTCSHPAVTTTFDDDGQELDPEYRTRRITYKDYLNMWKCLLTCSRFKELKHLGVGVEECQAFTEILYDELVSSILRVLDRLDLTCRDIVVDKDQDQDFEASEDSVISNKKQPAKPKDYIVFINLVDFCQDLLPSVHKELFHKWLFTFGHQLIVHSTMHPYVSGFYKLLSVSMTVASRIDYFQGIGKKIEREDANWCQDIKQTAIEDMEIDSLTDSDRSQREASFMLFSKFTKEVLVKLKQSKDDLLASCLLFILSLPYEIVITELHAIVPALQIALQIGYSYLPLANAALDALDTWSQKIPDSMMKPFYTDILQYLDPYLKSATDTDFSASAATDQMIILSTTKSNHKFGRRKIPIKVLKQKRKTLSERNQESQLAEIRRRCVLLLGSLGGIVNNMLVKSSTEQVTKSAMAWDNVKHLKFHVPFVDIKPVIYLDVFLPRVVEIATTSSECQTKAAACELLHSFVLYMLGRSSQQPKTKAARGEEMDKLYQKLFPVLLQLACDTEQVARQLFGPLVMQLIHWFTSVMMFQSEGTKILLECIMDGLVDPTNTALRDFSALCVHEFLQWAIKQTTKKQLESSPYNVEMLMNWIYNLARHPSAFKRLGASLAFNSIYTIFREEDSLVDIFTFEIMVVFVESLAIAHQDDKSLGTQKQAKQALSHLDRIIKKKADLLSCASKKRKKPKYWKEATLQICLCWLVRQCGRPQTECRHACMELVYSLSTSLPGVKRPHDFFSALIKGDKKYLLQRFESGMYCLKEEQHGISKRPKVTDMCDRFALKSVLTWFDYLLCTLDCYTWIFGQSLINPSRILVVPDEKGTVLFTVLSYFFDKLAQGDIEKAAVLFGDKPQQIFTPWEQEEYNRSKCTVIVRTIDFLVVLLKNYQQDSLKVIPDDFWSDSLWQTLASCVLTPSSIGFNMANMEILEKLPLQTQQLLTILKQKLPQNILVCFLDILKNMINSQGSADLFQLLPDKFDETKSEDLKLLQLVKGHEQLHLAGLLQSVLNKSRQTESVSVQLFDVVFKNEDLISRLLDKSPVKNMAVHSSSDHGAMFYACFKSTVNQHLVANCAEFLDHLLKWAHDETTTVGCILISMLEYIRQDRQLRKNLGSSVIKALLDRWFRLHAWWHGESATKETQSMALNILTKMILIDSKAVCNVQQKGFSHMFDMYLNMLVDKRLSLSFKSNVLDILAFFCSLPEDYIWQLKEKLERFVDNNFPQKSDQYRKGSPKYNEYIISFNKILSALELSGNLMLLELLISIICKEEAHAEEEHIQKTLTKMAKRLPVDKQKPAIEVPYRIFCNESTFKNAHRRAALERVCVTLLRAVSVPALKEFFYDHIKDIMFSIELQFSQLSVSESQMVTKLCNFELLEVMYSRLTREEVRSKNSTINQKYCYPKTDVEGKELTAAITKAAHHTKRENLQGEPVFLELQRQYRCAAYNTLIAVICCTQTEIKFYNGFLFSENINMGECLWDNLVDQQKEYEFPVELQNPHHKKLVAIRSEHRESENTDSSLPSVNYLASQYLADSSLMDDVSQYDFTVSVQTSSYTSTPSSKKHKHSRLTKGNSKEDKDVLDTEVTVQGDYVEIEMDELNKHECMAPLIGLLKHMARNNITPSVTKGETPASLPTWMSNIKNKLQCPSTSRNTRLFLVKLIINTEEVFKPYAKDWFGPLVQIITRGDLGTNGINYMISDLTITLLSWHTVAIPEDNSADKAMACQLLKVLVASCHHDSQQILKNNLELLKVLVEVWKPRLEVPTNILYENFSHYDLKTKRNMTGIQMTGVILANGLSPYRPNSGVDKDRFYKNLAKNMQHTSKAVYMSSAEVVGMALKHMTETEKEEDDKTWHKEFIDHISSLLIGFQSNKPDRFISCVYGMQLHFPTIADGFLAKVLFILPKVHGEFKTHSLEILQNRISQIDNAFLEMKSKGISDILSQRNEANQHAALRLVKGLCNQLKPAEILYLLPVLTEFASHPSASCRAQMYNILMWIYDNYRDDDGTDTEQIIQSVKETLLRGLSDKDIKNRVTLQNFWSHSTRLPDSTVDRLVALLETMYSPASEHQYLTYATNLLLEMTSRSPDYKRPIFEHPLSDCKFKDFHVRQSWRQRHSTMTPMFVDTQSTQTSSDGSSDGGSTSPIQLRATQDVQQFTATQGVGTSKGPYDWLTQSSIDTFADSDVNMSTETQSSLLFTIGATSSKSAPSHRQRVQQRPGPRFGKHSLQQGKAGNRNDSDDGLEILQLKRRFIKDSGDRSAYFARREARQRAIREEIAQEQRQRRENQVILYRKYRIGDLPDIQIEYFNIIAPLQALAQKDSRMAMLLLSTLFEAIHAELVTVCADNRSIHARISNSLNTMLSTTNQYYAPFINCILHMAYSNIHNLTLEPSNISSACLTGLQQPMGIMLLEKMLIHAENPTCQPSKKHRTIGPQVSRDINVWLELAKLYKSIGDYDTLKGIFGSKLGTKEITLEAMEAEMSGDYQTAVQLYYKALVCTDWDEEPDELEKDFWDASSLHCYEHLTQWNKLLECTLTNLDDVRSANLDRIWEDTYYQDTYLPYLIHSKLKLLLENGEGQDDLATFIDNAMKVTERRALLESQYSVELALLYIWQEEYDRAMSHVDQAIQLFLQNWAGLDALMSNSRLHHLRTLQKLTEMHEFLQFIMKNKHSISFMQSVIQANAWMRRSPDPVVDPTTIWDDVMSYRILYLDQMAQHLKNISKESEGMDDIFNEHKVNFRLKQAEAANQQNNFPVALKQMKATFNLVKGVKNKTLHIECYHEWTRIQHKKCKVASLTTNEKIKALIETMNVLEQRAVDDSRVKCSQHILQGQALFQLISLLKDDIHVLDEYRNEIQNITHCGTYDHEKVIMKLTEECYRQMKAAVFVASDSSCSDTDKINMAHMALVSYCDTYLRQSENDESGQKILPVLSSFPAAVTVSLLAAMKNNCSEARQRFPRLLQLTEQYPENMSLFIQKTSSVPTWMFLGWISQITALLDKPESPAIQDILKRLAVEYPQAVVYPFKMSCDGYKFSNDEQGKKAKAVMIRVNEELSKNPLIGKFINALEQLGQPDSLFKDWYQNLEWKECFSQPEKNKTHILTMYKDMYDQLLATETNDKGPYRTRFAEKYRRDFNHAFGTGGEKLQQFTYAKFQEEGNKILQKINNFEKPPEDIAEYSEWLANFQGCEFDQEIEIPGQYIGKAKPLPQYHTKISSFHSVVKTLQSMRKPKRIVIRGNDQKEYPFLVKGGEDLRLDQRIQQLFGLMNEIFSHASKCHQYNLQLRTYQVIPMTTRIGLIEWMKNTKTLKEILYETFTKEEKEFFISPNGPRYDYAKWMGVPIRDIGKPKPYQVSYSKNTRSDAITNFLKRENLVPWNLARRAYQTMAVSPEAFFVLKTNFTTSHAQLCVCHYILGIGDRHLSNFMVDLQSGRMIGIDFGYAFGSATQFLPIPELMPFRLTCQLRNLMLPLREKGLFESTMIHVLRALRDNQDIIINTMDVFIKEPSLDWKQNAMRELNQMQSCDENHEDIGIRCTVAYVICVPELMTDPHWYPKAKVAFACRKLNGHNPAHITRDELVQGHKGKTYCCKAAKVVLGDPEHDIRAKLPPKCLTVEEQVACLINQATDGNILSRVFCGWEPWM